MTVKSGIHGPTGYVFRPPPLVLSVLVHPHGQTVDNSWSNAMVRDKPMAFGNLWGRWCHGNSKSMLNVRRVGA